LLLIEREMRFQVLSPPYSILGSIPYYITLHCSLQYFPEVHLGQSHPNLETGVGSHLSIVQLTIPQCIDALCKPIEKLDAIALEVHHVDISIYLICQSALFLFVGCAFLSWHIPIRTLALGVNAGVWLPLVLLAWQPFIPTPFAAIAPPGVPGASHTKCLRPTCPRHVSKALTGTVWPFCTEKRLPARGLVCKAGAGRRVRPQRRTPLRP